MERNTRAPYRVTCNNCNNKNLSSRSVVTHNIYQHGIRGRIRDISNPVDEPENVQEEEQVFFTTESQMSEIEEVYVTTIPRSRHNEPESLKAKEKELNDFSTFDVYEVVPIPAKTNMIATQWVLVDKEMDDGSIKRKARLCMRGDCEKNKHLIPTDSPTVNKVTLKLMLTIAASKGWDISCSDVTRAFLQTERI